jgi:hypothetical protein
VDRLSDELLDTLKKSGCYLVSYGFESCSSTILESMKKRITPEQIHRAVHMTLSRGISIQANFIFGDKAETPETAEETFRFWREHAEAGIFLGFVHPYPNSELYQYCLQKGIIKDRIDFFESHLADRINMTAMSDYQFFLLVAKAGLHTLHYLPTASPSRVEAERLVARCPHCGAGNEYRNYQTFSPGSHGLRGYIGRLLLNRVIYCRQCRLRFWGRTRVLRFLGAISRPLFWPGIFQAAFGAVFLAQQSLPAIRRRLSSGTLDKRHK